MQDMSGSVWTPLQMTSYDCASGQRGQRCQLCALTHAHVQIMCWVHRKWPALARWEGRQVPRVHYTVHSTGDFAPPIDLVHCHACILLMLIMCCTALRAYNVGWLLRKEWHYIEIFSAYLARISMYECWPAVRACVYFGSVASIVGQMPVMCKPVTVKAEGERPIYGCPSSSSSVTTCKM